MIQSAQKTVEQIASARRVLVTGPRNYSAPEAVHARLTELHADEPIAVLIHGDTPSGVDAAADHWARLRNIPVERYPTQWDQLTGVSPSELSIGTDKRGRRFNKMAKFANNSEMLRRSCPTVVLAFPYADHQKRCAEMSDLLSKARTAERNGADLEIIVHNLPFKLGA